MPTSRLLRFESLEPRNLLASLPLPGDANFDSHVNIFDVNAISLVWGATSPPPSPGDVNADGRVNIFDVNLVAANWGRVLPPVPDGGYEKLFAPPAGFTSAVMWMEAIQDLSNPEIGRIEVDAMRLKGIVNGQEVILSNDTFDEPLGWTPGGLYLRDPWYGAGTPDEGREWPMSVGWGNGSMNIELTETNRVYHWWTPIRVSLPEGLTRMWGEADVRISGGAMVAAGIDYWLTPDAPYAGYEVNNREAGSTGWYTAYDWWQEIDILKPA